MKYIATVVIVCSAIASAHANATMTTKVINQTKSNITINALGTPQITIHPGASFIVDYSKWPYSFSGFGVTAPDNPLLFMQYLHPILNVFAFPPEARLGAYKLNVTDLDAQKNGIAYTQQKDAKPVVSGICSVIDDSGDVECTGYENISVTISDGAPPSSH
ncbi:hypothetical protein ACE1BS_24930 [Aeromonas jandaei]